MRNVWSFLAAGCLVAGLSACGSGNDFDLGSVDDDGQTQQDSNTDASGNDTTDTSGNDVTDSSGNVVIEPEVTLALGTGTGSGFVAGGLTTTVDGGQLSFGGDTTVSVNIVDSSTGLLYTDGAVTVNFNSVCATNQQATIDTGVITANGIAQSTYDASTCLTSDTIVATLANDSSVVAQGSIDIASQELGSIEFVSASPQQIALKGGGSSTSPEVSEVTFQLRDSTGQAIANREVAFELSSNIGGAELANASAFTDAEGNASTILNSGTIPTSVTIDAIVTDPDTLEVVQTSSLQIAIAGSIPDQDSFSLSVNTFNPRGFDFDGSEVSFTIRASDRNNNRVSDGTQVSFVTSGGSIDSSCTISDGACSVTWNSQNPRPIDGLVRVLARTTGEETFTDQNGNGLFDPSEPFEAITEEAYNDENGNGSYDLGEFFSDFNDDEQFSSGATGFYQGSACSQAAFDAGHCSNLIDVRETATICMSTDDVILSTGTPSLVNLGGLQGTVFYTLTDGNNLTPASGTEVAVSVENLDLVAGDTVVVPNECRTGGFTFAVTVGPDEDNDTVSGQLKVSVTRVDQVVEELSITFVH